MNAPQVSVVLPAFNRLALLREACASVLTQTFGDWELIVADDGSGDETQTWLRTLDADPRVRLLWLNHTGNPGATRNAALQVARGHYVAFLDSDDRWLPHKLATQLQALRASRCRWSYSAFTRIDRDGRALDESQPWWQARQGAIFEALLRFAAVVPTPAVMVERTLLEQVGGFDVSLAQFEDYHLWLRLCLQGEVLLVDEPLLEVRSHDQHYYRPGMVALERWRRMLEALQDLPMNAEQRAALGAAHRRNTLQLARGLAARGEQAAAAALMAQGGAVHGGDPRWWLGAAATRLYVSAPHWLRGGYQRLRGRPPA